MAASDRASLDAIELFEKRQLELEREFLLFQLPDVLWEMLEEILEDLSVMTAFYSYGNGEVTIDLSPKKRADYFWSQPDLTIYYLVYFTRKYLSVELSDHFFRSEQLVFWYEMADGIEIYF